MRLTKIGIGIDIVALYVFGMLVVLGILLAAYKFTS